MKIETQPRDDHQLTMIVEIEAERLEGAKHRAARKVSERSKIAGFRPGKAPYDVIRRQYGDAAITEQAIEFLVDEVYPEALKQAEIEPASAGSLEKIERLEPLQFIFTVPLEPTVDLGDYRSIRLAYDWQAPGGDKVDQAIDQLRHMHSTMDTVDRPVQEGDFVMLDIKGVDTQAGQGEAPVVERPGHPIYVRTDEKEVEWPFAGFSRQLIGMSVGESKNLTHEYDQDDAVDDLRGLTVDFEVTLNGVRGVILPEINDEFAKKVGSLESLSALRDVLRANLAQRSKEDYDADYFNRLIEEIKKGATIKYPPQVLDHEIEHVIKDLVARLADQNLDLDAYLKMRAMDKEKYIAEEVKPAAAYRLERTLILNEVGHSENIELDQEMLKDTIQKTWGEMQGDPDFQKTMRGKSTPPKQLMEAVTMNSAHRVITQQALARLKEIAIGQATEIPADESETNKKPVEAEPEA